DLWDSILEHQEELPLSSAQQQELERRLENYKKNPTTGSSWEEVKKRLGFSQSTIT
ncbi:MAG: addiction module protein, partial [Dolichospermum sp.]